LAAAVLSFVGAASWLLVDPSRTLAVIAVHSSGPDVEGEEARRISGAARLANS
jgi:hypothetical protein